MATVKVVYEVKGGGVDIPQSHERHYEWSVEDRYEVRAMMKAQNPSPFGAESAGKGGAKPAANEGDFMARMMAAQQKCRGDDACMQREVLGVEAGNFQQFLMGTQSGTYKIQEKAHRADFDAACSLRNETPCAYDTTITGAGAVTMDGKTEFMTGAHAEVDLNNGTLLLTLPWPGFASATEVVTSASKHIKTGTRKIDRKIWLNDVNGKPVKVSCGACKAASGTEKREVKDEILGRKATLTINWSFSRP